MTYYKRALDLRYIASNSMIVYAMGYHVGLQEIRY